MRTIKKIFITGLIALLTQFVYAQDTITVSDAVEMRVKAELLIKREFKELLDNISTNESTQNTKDVINGSHSGTNNKIFLNEKVRVEDDINPAFKNTAGSHEVTINQYLNDFDLFYKKSESPSVFFNDIRASNVKKVTDIYVKVYFKSLFKNPNKYSDTVYTENNRAAEIRFLKVDKRWVPYITAISFFNPSDTLNDILNDVLVIREKGKNDNLLLSDSSNIAAQKTFADELKAAKEKEEIDAYKKLQEDFITAMSEGNKAMDQNDFTGALKAYKQAQSLKPYDLLPLTKIDKAKYEQNKATLNQIQLYTQYARDAKILVLKRRYKEALESYQQAIEQKPDSAQAVEPEINRVTKIYRVLSTLEEKYNAGLYKDAIRQYKDANKKDGENSDYYLGIARCYDKMGEQKDALKNYNKSYELDNNNLETIEQRAILYKKLLDFPSALIDYKLYVLLVKDNIKIYEEMAELRLLINNNTDDAIKFLDDGIRSNPKSAELYLKKGLLLVRKNDLKEADKNFTSSIKIDSSGGFAFFNRGKCQYWLKHFKSAATDFEFARAAGLEATYLAQIAAFADTLNQKSLAKFNQNAIDSALYYVNYAIDIDPSNSSCRFNKGEYLFSVNKLEDAIVNYNTAIGLVNNNADNYFKRGLSYFKLKKYIPAINDLRSADSLNHALFMASKYLGDSYYAISDFAGASVYYENSLKTIDAGKMPVSPEVVAEIYNLLGETYFKQANYEKALSAFKSSLKKNSNLALAYYNRGMTYYQSNDLSNATEDLSKAVSLQADKYEWFYAFANACQDKKEFQRAVENYTYCIKLDSAHKKNDAVYYKGFCNYQLQNWDLALKDYENFRKNTADSSVKDFDLQLGVIFLNISKKDSAYNCFYRYYLTDTTNGWAMYNIGRALYFDGKTDESMAWFDRSFQTKMVSKSDIKKDKMNDLFWEDKKFKPLRSKYF